MSKHTEIFAYEIADENLDAFLEIKATLIEEAKTLPGLEASATFRSMAQPNLFIDRMHWKDTAAAQKGNELFQSLPTTGRFLSLMSGPPKIAGPFDLIAGA